jgi:hypothetical protein
MRKITIICHQKTSLYLVGVQFKPNNMVNCLAMVTTCNNNLSSVTWHHKLGHLHYEAIKEFIKSNMAIGLANVLQPTPQFEGCILRRQTLTCFLNYHTS